MNHKPALAVFITYIWTKTLLGLALSPYKSVQKVTRHRILLPVVFSPLYGLVLLFILGRIGSFFFEVEGPLRTLVSLTLSTALISILMWQLFLIYLLLSFHLALKKS